MCDNNDGKTPCACPPLSLEKLTQPTILMLLAQQPTHGYDLIQKLNHSDCIDGELEAATVYRTLRRMEHDGLIVSRWEHGEFGPARRQYELTGPGREHLEYWANSLKARMRQLENFISHYKDIKD